MKRSATELALPSAPKTKATKTTTVAKSEKAKGLFNQPSKSIAEQVQEQKEFFEKKNAILKMLKFFESNRNGLIEMQNKINEALTEDEFAFQNSTDFEVVFKEGYSSATCKIKAPTVIADIITATLKEIDTKVSKLEEELITED